MSVGVELKTPSNSPDAPSLGEAKYVIQEAIGQLESFWDDDEWTEKKLYALFRSYFPAADVPVMVRKLNDQLEGKEGLNSPAFRKTIHQITTESFAKKLELLDPFTQAASMGIYPKMDSKALKFSFLSPAFFMEPFRNPGSFSYVTGPITVEAAKANQYQGASLGVGKSNTAALFMEMFIQQGYRVVTNYDVKECPSGILMVRTLRNMLMACIKNLKAGFMTIIIIDEFSQAIAKESGTAGGWVTLKKLMYLFRKVGASLMIITQREQEVPYAIQQMSVCHIQKKSKTVMNFRSNNNMYLVSEIPATRLKYDTFYFSPFEIDLDVTAMHARLASARPEDNQLDIVCEYLDEVDQLITKDDLMKFAKVGYVVAHMTQQEIADWLMDLTGPIQAPTRRTIGNWLDKQGVKEVLTAGD